MIVIQLVFLFLSKMKVFSVRARERVSECEFVRCVIATPMSLVISRPRPLVLRQEVQPGRDGKHIPSLSHIHPHYL